MRIKDITDLQGPRDNILHGVGLVTGLQGTGDSSAAARRFMANLLRRYDLNVSESDVNGANTAVVNIRAILTPGLRNGNRIDVTVTSPFNATSLVGGVLLPSPLLGGSTKDVYAVAEGPILVGGFSATGAASSVKKNQTTVGSIPGGAIIERELPVQLLTDPRRGIMELTLRSPDFATANRVALAINEAYPETARCKDMKSVEIKIPKGFDDKNLIAFVAAVQELTVVPDQIARVIINERTGTIVAGSNVRVSTVAITHGSLIITIAENPEVSMPEPFTEADPVVVDRTDLSVTEEKANFVIVHGNSSVADLAQALNAIGATPRDLLTIFQMIKKAGALHAELVIMG